MVLFIRDNECFEPRVKNYLNYFDKNNIEHKVIAWNRNGTARPRDNYIFLQRRAEYGKKWKNIPNKLIWLFFAMAQVFKNRKQCHVIHACDFDAIIPALLVGKLFKKTIVFDIFDWADAQNKKNLMDSTLSVIQNSANKHSDFVIICDEARKAQARTKSKHLFVLPNIPLDNIHFDTQSEISITEERKKYRLTLSYVGVFDKDRGLEDLLEIVSKNYDIKLNIAGFGKLLSLVQDYDNKYENVTYWGRVEYNLGQTILKNSDLMIGFYHLTSALHKYAAPNKYYESLMLQVPLVTTQNTLVGDKVNKYNTGFVIDENPQTLLDLLTNPRLSEMINQCSINCKKIWETKYECFFNDFMKTHYVEILNYKKSRQ